MSNLAGLFNEKQAQALAKLAGSMSMQAEPVVEYQYSPDNSKFEDQQLEVRGTGKVALYPEGMTKTFFGPDTLDYDSHIVAVPLRNREIEGYAQLGQIVQIRCKKTGKVKYAFCEARGGVPKADFFMTPGMAKAMGLVVKDGGLEYPDGSSIRNGDFEYRIVADSGAALYYQLKETKYWRESEPLRLFSQEMKRLVKEVNDIHG